MKTLILAAIRCALLFLVPTVTYAISAQWELDPISGDWNTAANWTPMGIPNGPADIATFGLSNTTDVSISANTEVNGIIFTPAATNPYTITATSAVTLTISGVGITNNSGITQNFVCAGQIVFKNSATAGNVTFVTGNSVIFFLDTSSAGNATIRNNSPFGSTRFSGTSTAGNATIINDGPFGFTNFFGNSTAGNATIIANGNGGRIFFENDSDGGTSRIEVFGNGTLDFSFHNAGSATIGSLEGDGNVALGNNNLSIGTNNLSTNFSGGIFSDFRNHDGTLTKVGSGTLIFSGANNYVGNTYVRGGVLQVDGSTTSNTYVYAGGTLAGTGTLNRNVTDTAGGTVSPGHALGLLSVNGTYKQASYGALMISIAGTSTGQFSVLDVAGTANLAGAYDILNPVLLNGFVPTIGDSFTFLNYSSLNGTFFMSDANIDNLNAHWEVTYGPNSAILTVAPGNVPIIPIPDQGSTFLLLTLGLLGLVTYCRQFIA